MAVGALHALASAQLRAGRDVSVIGYDDLPIATYTDPPLTTLAQPIERMARRMVEMRCWRCWMARMPPAWATCGRRSWSHVGRTGWRIRNANENREEIMWASLAALSGVLVLSAFSVDAGIRWRARRR